jgi:hypothetical protein
VVVGSRLVKKVNLLPVLLSTCPPIKHAANLLCNVKMSDVNKGDDWNGAYPEDSKDSPPPKKTSAFTKFKAVVLPSNDTIVSAEELPPVKWLDHPLVKLSPFFAGGMALLLGAKAGYGRQLDRYEVEETRWGEKKDKWGRKVMAPRDVSEMPKNWSPHNVAIRALGIGTMVAVGSFALGTGVTFWYFDVESPQEFSEKMKTIIPPKFQAIQKVVRPSLESLKDSLQRVGNMFKPEADGTGTVDNGRDK